MFDEICSIYESATDAYGRFVDRETGECITEMSIHDFCLTDRWKPYVEKLRAMRKEYGSKAKKMDDYIATKKMLPGATLSGRFSLFEDDSLTHPGQRVMVSRRETHLAQHTGWLAIDIDLQDNTQLANFDNIRMVAQFRPEVGLLMRSCSGTGYFGLVRLAYPDRHKEQFKALLKEYAALGIVLDKSCGNIGRVRFASWDDKDHIYINEKVQPYQGIAENELMMPTLLHREPYFHRNGSSPSGNHLGNYQQDTPEIIYLKAQRLVSKIEACGVDVMGSYEDWVKCGMSLYHVSSTAGYDMWKRVSRFRPMDSTCGHHEMDFRKRWNQFAGYNKVTAATFFGYCKRANITLSHDDLCEIYQNNK